MLAFVVGYLWAALAVSFCVFAGTKDWSLAAILGSFWPLLPGVAAVCKIEGWLVVPS